MQPLTDLIKGLEVLEPFLQKHGFSFANYENGKGSGGQFTIATYINSRKKLVIGYRFSIGEIAYQFDNFIVGHSFYIKHLGYADKGLFPGFQSDDKLLAFKNILHDFYFLTDDFFNGECKKLKEAALLQQNFIIEHNKKSEEEYNNRLDLAKINNARQYFKEKNYSESFKIYNSIENKKLITKLDEKFIIITEKRKE